MVEIGLKLSGSFSLEVIHTFIIRVWLNFCNDDIKQICVSDDLIIVVFNVLAVELDNTFSLFDNEFKSLEGVSSMEVGVNV